MAVNRITREDMVEQSVQDFLRSELFSVRGYPTDRVELMDAFRPSLFEEMSTLDKTYLALGFNFDDGGKHAELGSTLMQRVYTVEVWVIAQTPEAGRNLANAAREAVDHAGAIPLKDLTQPGEPVIDALILERARVERQPVPDPKPWQENIFIVYIALEDIYYA